MQESLEVGNTGLEEHKSFDVFSTEASSAVRTRVTSRAETMFTRHTIRIRYDDAIRPNTNRLFGPLFGTKANTNRVFGTSLDIALCAGKLLSQTEHFQFSKLGTINDPMLGVHVLVATIQFWC